MALLMAMFIIGPPGGGGGGGGGYQSGGGGGYNSGGDDIIVQEDTIFVAGMDPNVTVAAIANYFGVLGIIKVDFLDPLQMIKFYIIYNPHNYRIHNDER